MKLTITGRHDAVGEEARRYVAGKIGKLAHFFDRVTKAEVILDRGAEGRYEVELIVTAPPHGVLTSVGRGRTATAAFDEAIGRAERRLVRWKDRLHPHPETHDQRASRWSFPEPKEALR